MYEGETYEEREKREKEELAKFSYAPPINRPQTTPTEPEPIDLAAIDQLDATALRALIRRVSGAMWGIGLKTREEIADAFKLKLAIGGMSEKDMFKALPIMREWFDRELGKAAQSIAMTVEDKGITKLSDDRLLRLERELARMTGQDAIIIAPAPKKLDVDSTMSQ